MSQDNQIGAVYVSERIIDHRKITDYHMLIGPADTQGQWVTAAIKSGWQPFGSAFQVRDAVFVRNSPIVGQAVVKYET